MNLVECIERRQPLVYAKYGDGEYFAAIGRLGANCDRTPYTPELGHGIIQSFKYVTQFPHVYIGKREQQPTVVDYFQTLVERPIQWEKFGFFMFESLPSFLEREHIYKAIQHATQQKLYICNETMVQRSKLLFDIDTHIIVDPTNWFSKDYTGVLTQVSAAIKNPEHILILISAGMGAKVLIADLMRTFPSAIILDIGSALDLVCSRRISRDYHKKISYSDLQEIYRRLLKNKSEITNGNIVTK
jgi:hypothetical protein